MLFGVFIYPGAEPIDLATYGVLSMAKRIRPEIDICTIAPQSGITILSNGLRIVVDYDIGAAPRLDMLVVTGGPGWVEQSRSTETCAFIRRHAAAAPLLSVCTGGMILAASGVLDGKTATTKRRVVPPEISPLQRLRAEYPGIDTREASLVDAGSIVTGGGVSLCIDAMLYVLARRFGDDMAFETARSMEYDRAWAANRDLFPPIMAAG